MRRKSRHCCRCCRWYFDVQNRTRRVHDVDQFVVRPGVGRSLGERSSLWIGYAYTANLPDIGEKFIEHRIWEQYLWSGPAGPGTLSLRSRVEQRFFPGSRNTAWRVRQQARLARPPAAHPSLSLILWDEVLAHLNSTSHSRQGLDQNRFFGGLARSVNPHVRVEAGYMNQFVRSTGANKMHHVFSGVISLGF